ncbi:MAG TPA: hypothetical protein VE994_07165 [Terriglobales bacterium]|nr:hypothetical protein [Terriglobales bacterium]
MSRALDLAVVRILTGVSAPAFPPFSRLAINGTDITCGSMTSGGEEYKQQDNAKPQGR